MDKLWYKEMKLPTSLQETVVKSLLDLSCPWGLKADYTKIKCLMDNQHLGKVA
jgi:hypothetical protein